MKGISKLVSLLHSMDPALRLNGLWGLKNLAYEAELPLKQAILTYEVICIYSFAVTLINMKTEN